MESPDPKDTDNVEKGNESLNDLDIHKEEDDDDDVEESLDGNNEDEEEEDFDMEDEESESKTRDDDDDARGEDEEEDLAGESDGGDDEEDGEEEGEDDANNEENDDSGDDDDDDEVENKDAAKDEEENLAAAQDKHIHRRSKIFDDSITVSIPLDVTADLKIAIMHTREKRIKSILRKFPSIKKLRNQSMSTNGDSGAVEDDDDAAIDADDNDVESNSDEKKSAKSKTKKTTKPGHIPQPDRFGSVLDYLEAKYVRGVMLEEDGDDGEVDGDEEEKSEGQGSVYSKDSFLDDTDLQRDVAEQVMATTTQTRLELEDNDEFFVNVGNLEVENDEYGDQYDPLLDKENANKKKKKRKKATTPTQPSATKSTKVKIAEPPAKKKKKTPDVKSKPKPSPAAKPAKTPESAPGSAKSKKSTGSASTVKTKKTTSSSSPSKSTTKKSSSKAPKDPEAVKAMKAAKKKSDSLYRKVLTLVKKLPADSLPKRQSKLKVALTCPDGKGPGSEIMFTNPHNKKQRLKVKVPKDVKPGGQFKVTVPVKHPDADSGNSKDHNKFGREIQDLLDDYGRAYDDYCTARFVVYPKFEIHKEKQAKFDKMAKEFPTGLITPVTPNYLKQVARRARQNKYKRQKTAEARQHQVETLRKEGDNEDEAASGSEDEQEEMEEDEVESPERSIDIPGRGAAFPSISWNSDDFELD